MIKVQYQFEVDESVNATLDFLESRPILKYSLKIINALCLIALIFFIALAFIIEMGVSEVFKVMFCVLWLVGRRKINFYLSKKAVLRQKVNDGIFQAHILENKLWWKDANNQINEQKWSLIKKVVTNKAGFMVPIVGIEGVGKYVWLPFRAFKNHEDILAFKKLLLEKKIRII